MSTKPSDRERGRPSGGIIRTLACDTAGNALAMMAAFTIPLAALAGSAVDMSRAYLVRVRLQQACDAGVLAGRKMMIVTSGTYLDPTAPADPANPTNTTPAYKQAKAFFDNNFPNSPTNAGWMQTTNVSFTPSRMSDGQVTATATATMPMAIMKMFGFAQMTQTVSCNARLDIGDTDIMFVLDTTGSMACVTGSGCSSIVSYTREDGSQGYYRIEQSGSKMAGLRSAVVTFYNTLAANAPAAAHIRYGFVPYASSVNVGQIIMDNSPAATGMPVNPGNPNYIVNSWAYQSRRLWTGGTVAGGIPSDVTNGLSTNEVTNNVTEATCDANVGRTPAGTTTTSLDNYTTSGRADVRTKTSWSRTSGSGTSALGTCTIKKQPVKVRWTYQQVSYDVSGYKSSLGPSGTAVPDPSKITGATSKWTGCIEERDTTATNSFTQGSLPADLDPDLVPTNDATRWRPMWPEVVYYRSGTAASTDTTAASTSPYGDTDNDGSGDSYTSPAQAFNMTANYYACGKAAQRLKTMSLAEVQSYISAAGDFRALGYTYHDVGMTWGLRLLSPQGIWREDTGAWPGNNPPSRYIVFMSDGALQTNDNAYYTYGLEKIDRRATGGTLNDDTNHNARFQAVCTAAKNKGITVFVVAFDTALTTDMTNCATSGFAYTATDSTALNAAFASIARQIVKLRLSQ